MKCFYDSLKRIERINIFKQGIVGPITCHLIFKDLFLNYLLETL